MPRYKVTIAYDGTAFYGWQKQQPPDKEPLRTVQKVMEEAVMELTKVDKVDVVGASRTDSGVHAIGQIGTFVCEREYDLRKLPMMLTARLPADVHVLDAEIVHDDFCPISECTSKGYRYTLTWGCKKEIRRPLFDRHVIAWTAYELELAPMQEAAKYIVGEHDFASFTRKNHGKESTVRKVFSCEVRESGLREIQMDISGNGFLYHMVRIVAGTLLEAGRGYWAPEKIIEIFEAKDRKAAGMTMPPEGLRLEWVSYEQ
ncbi:MAG: tRNA pseudouridine(38-40) synthase TruA [Planctomycetota bacterium]|nr:tRNA pseudouridine(38-40) synthase TruA [Planctomycetota bacterium]